MSNSDGTLTTEQNEKFLAWLRDRGKSHKCPVCKENDWWIGEHFLLGLIHIPDKIAFGGPSYPQAFIVCNNCAYTRTFMAVQIGLIKNSSEVGEEDE